MSTEQKKPLIIITGPTAVGKSALSVMLAGKIGGSIISADSVQVYKHMDIGSAKISSEEMGGIRHYLIDVLEPEDSFNVVSFAEMARTACTEIYSDGRIPIVTGGTGFYIQALLYDVDFTESMENDPYRESLREYAVTHGNEALHRRLEAVDPDAAAQIHPNNIKRVIRALEFHEQTGDLISRHNAEQHEKRSPYDFCYFVLTDEREEVYRKIDERVDMMMAAGLETEVRKLLEAGCTPDMVSMQALGYRQIARYIAGEYSLDEAVSRIKEETRHFAKRQLTWFRRERDVIWVNKNDFGHDDEKIMAYMLEQLHEHGILKQ